MVGYIFLSFTIWDTACHSLSVVPYMGSCMYPKQGLHMWDIAVEPERYLMCGI